MTGGLVGTKIFISSGRRGVPSRDRRPGTPETPHDGVEAEQNVTTPGFFRGEPCFGALKGVFRRKWARRVAQDARTGRRPGSGTPPQVDENRTKTI